VDTPTGRTLPRWITLPEAGLVTGLPEQTLVKCVESGLVAAERVLSRRLGMTFLLVDTNDLVTMGLLRPSEVRADQIDAILKGREQVDVLDLESPRVAVEPAPAASAPPTPDLPPTIQPSPVAPAEQTPDLGDVVLPEWVTLREAAFITGHSEEFLQRHIDSGVIASRSLGRRRGSGFTLLRSIDLGRALLADQAAPTQEVTERTAGPVTRRPAVAAAPVMAVQPGEMAHTGSRALRWARRLGVWTVLLVSGLTLLLVTLPLAFGYHTAAVRSDDMEPAFHVGDLVIARTESPGEVRPGQVVTFRDPIDPARLIIQRVQVVDTATGSVRFTTRSDASGRVVEWSVPSDGRVGVVERRFGRFGHILTFVQSRTGQVVLIVTPLLVLGLMIVIRAWRRPQRGVEAIPS